MAQEEIGEVTRYFGKIGVAAIMITSAPLRVGDRIRIEGHGGDMEQVVESIQLDRESVEVAQVGQEVGIKVDGPVRPKDMVYKAD